MRVSVLDCANSLVTILAVVKRQRAVAVQNLAEFLSPRLVPATRFRIPPDKPPPVT